MGPLSSTKDATENRHTGVTGRGRSLWQLALDPTLELLFVSEDGGPLTADLACPSALRLLLSVCLEDGDSGCEYHSVHSAPRSSAQVRENA